MELEKVIDDDDGTVTITASVTPVPASIYAVAYLTGTYLDGK